MSNSKKMDNENGEAERNLMLSYGTRRSGGEVYLPFVYKVKVNGTSYNERLNKN